MPDEYFTCTTPGDGMGYGRGFAPFAIVDSDVAIIATSQSFDYADPEISMVYPSAFQLATEGGTVISISGTNLGPVGKRRLYYQRPSGSADGQARFECQATTLPGGAEPQHNFTCASVEGSGANLHWALVINGEMGYSSLSGPFVGDTPPEPVMASEQPADQVSS